MTGRLNELSERMEERLASLNELKEIISESGDSEINEMLEECVGRMYGVISEISEEVTRIRKTER
jgi:hypothetical protein